MWNVNPNCETIADIASRVVVEMVTKIFLLSWAVLVCGLFAEEF